MPIQSPHIQHNFSASKVIVRRIALRLSPVAIVPQVKGKVRYYRNYELSNYIRRRQLTESLQLCERYGFKGDLGTFIISQLQDSLVRRAAR